MIDTLPNNIGVEMAIIGSGIVYPDSMKVLVEAAVDPKDFYSNAHQQIYAEMVDAYNSGKNPDVTILVSLLIDRDILDNVGGVSYIGQLQSKAVTPNEVKRHITILKEKKYLRELIITCNEISEKAYENPKDIDEVLDSAEKSILKISHQRTVRDFRTSREVAQIVLDKVKEMNSNKSNVTGFPTGYADMDRKTNGLQKGDLIILAARPSMGKTAFALNLALNVSLRSDDAVAIFSLEMPAEQLISRMLSARSQVPGNKIKTGFVNTTEMNQISETVLELKETPLYIEDSSVVKIPEIFSKCRKLKSEKGLSLIVIDYIQLITGAGRSESRQQEVSEISRSLKNLARELEVPVIALSQLSRSVEKREDKRPMLSDLRESGSIEQDADIVMFLYRDGYYKREEDGEQPPREEVEINFAKHRNGATGLIKLAFEANVNAFFGLSDKED